MKKSFIILLIVSGAVMTYVFHACSKSFLDRPLVGALSEPVVANQKGVDQLLIGAYSLLDGYQNSNGIGGWESAASNWVFGSIVGGDAHKGTWAGDQPDIGPIETFTANATNNYFNVKWKAVYEGVMRTNTVLKILAQATDVSDANRVRITAEARFLRGHYHFEAKKMWGNAPYIDETMAEFTVPNEKVNVPNTSDIWPQIEADFQYAYDNLPGTMPNVGRANKWAAGAYLGKTLLFEKKFSNALTVLNDVYTNGTTSLGLKYMLLDKYQDNFNAATKNSRESVFAVQSSVNDAAGAANANYGDVLNAPYGGPFDCCGFFQPSQDLVNSFKVDATSGLPNPDNYNAAPQVTSDEGIQITQPFTPYAGTIDSRLDWAVGRRGIPYLDWGLHQGISWQRDQAYGGPYNTKKNVYYKSQKGTLTDGSFWASTVTAINTNLIRFSDVILMLAEAEIEAGSLEKARALVNEVRARAAKPSSWVVLDGTTTPAANYKVGLYNDTWTDKAAALKALKFERKLEFAMEGHRFFDLVRWGDAATVLNKYLDFERNIRPFFGSASFTAGKHEVYPIPQRQIDLSKNVLVQNPGY
ncbi:RagB/SusD family nutrient uptake outer membrane protein [Pollutibacter soli]|uniref:RagB/SusD family nutrient uptake outer membrane protein n=1 Tax=Pollutibacter soli TaxID=3034157 RepID=UPI00301409FF